MSGAKRGKRKAAPTSVGAVHVDLAKALATVFAAGVYNREELQTAVCNYVAEMKKTGESGEAVVRGAQDLVREVGARFPSSDRAQVLLADMVTWCLAEYYRESA